MAWKAPGLATRRLAPYSTSGAPSLGGRPFRIAVCGAGPSGFYATGRLLSLPGSEATRVDLFEQLPVPFGLSRYGVAPDHPEVKNCEHRFEETAKDPRFRFFGNVQLSGSSAAEGEGAAVPNPTFASRAATQAPLDLLRATYDAVLLTYGAAVDRLLSIPGESDLQHVLSARTFVNWYNGHPFHSPLHGTAPLLDLGKAELVTVVGQGNVALDVARILLTPIDVLAKTDMADYALAELARSRVRRVEVVGRRGPLQIACTTKEVRELMNIPGVSFVRDEAIVDGAAELLERPDVAGKMSDARMKRRLVQLMQKGSKTPLVDSQKEWSFEFLRSPEAFLSDDDHAGGSTMDRLLDPRPVRKVVWQENEIVPDGDGSVSDWSSKSRGPRHRVTTEADIVLKSVGYRSIPLPGLPFDDRRGVVRNVDGRVIEADGDPVEGLYVSGWLARGPTGVIATTMYDAFSVADAIAIDLSPSSPKRGDIRVADVVADPSRSVSWRGWERIDREERRRGESEGRPRQKITSIDEMLAVASA